MATKNKKDFSKPSEIQPSAAMAFISSVTESQEDQVKKNPIVKGAKKKVSKSPSTYAKKKSYTFTLNPYKREVSLPHLTELLGLKSDSATLEFLVDRAVTMVDDPSWNKEQGNLFETF